MKTVEKQGTVFLYGSLVTELDLHLLWKSSIVYQSPSLHREGDFSRIGYVFCFTLIKLVGCYKSGQIGKRDRLNDQGLGNGSDNT